MRTGLTADEIGGYRDRGFLAIPDFLDEAELAAWRDAVEDAVSSRGDRKRPDADWAAGDSYYDRVFVQRLNLWQDSPKVRRLMLDPRIGKLACELEGLDGIRIWHDQALWKAPWANPTAWHLDCPYWSFSHRQAISIWIALDDATVENGCLWYLPGTHREARFDNAPIGENMNALFRTYPEFGTRRAVAVPLKAGGCALHNGLLAHGANANMTPGWRRAMTCAFMPDGATFNGQPNIYPRPLLERTKPGDVLDENDQNPLLWHTTKPYRAGLDRLLAVDGPILIR